MSEDPQEQYDAPLNKKADSLSAENLSPEKSSANSSRAHTQESDAAQPNDKLMRRHLRIGWWSILCFLSWGVVLEALHVFGAEFYRGVGAETSRLMWRLAHVHGALLGLVHIAFGVRIFIAAGWISTSRRIASYCLLLASILLPAGFLLGGVFVSGGDPSVGVALVPVGALLLFTAVLLTARGISTS